jgi:hypothetical protein
MSIWINMEEMYTEYWWGVISYDLSEDWEGDEKIILIFILYENVFLITSVLNWIKFVFIFGFWCGRYRRYPALPLSVFEIRRKNRKYSNVEIMFVRVGNFIIIFSVADFESCLGVACLHCVGTHCKSLYHHLAYHHNSTKFGTLQWHSSCAE